MGRQGAYFGIAVAETIFRLLRVRETEDSNHRAIASRSALARPVIGIDRLSCLRFVTVLYLAQPSGEFGAGADVEFLKGVT